MVFGEAQVKSRDPEQNHRAFENIFKYIYV